MVKMLLFPFFQVRDGVRHRDRDARILLRPPRHVLLGQGSSTRVRTRSSGLKKV